MEKIKAHFSITYDSGIHIELVAMFDNIKAYADTVRDMEDYMDNPSIFNFNVKRLTPYNDDANADILSTDILVSLKGLLFIQTNCEVIRYEEPVA